MTRTRKKNSKKNVKKSYQRQVSQNMQVCHHVKLFLRWLIKDNILFLNPPSIESFAKKNTISHGRSEKPKKRPISMYVASAPNEVCMWDITYLNEPVKGIFYYLCLITDLFSRDIVGREVWAVESAEHASELIKRTALSQRILSTDPLVFHSDN